MITNNQIEANSQFVLWCDCEMTGLDLAKDQLIEVALLVTDWEFNAVEVGPDIVIKPSEDALNGMSDFVRNMHEDNGLLAKLADGVSPEQADAEISNFLKKFEIDGQKLILAGNSIHSDRKFIDKFLPKFADALHYRMLDVSSFKLIAEQVHNLSFEKGHSHRAGDDIKESIAELKFYQAKMFK